MVRTIPTTVGHYAFLKAMLFEAAYWRSDQPQPAVEEGLRRPDIEKILKDWGQREGDTAFVTTVDEQNVGAAWYRFWTQESHSYGFISAEIPEIGIGVRRLYAALGFSDVSVGNGSHTMISADLQSSDMASD